MDALLRERWALTLESGNYQQATGVLRNRKNECCCLGVLCDLVDPSGWGYSNSRAGAYPVHYHNEVMPSASFLEEIGLEQNDANRLSKLNDSGMSFDDIAKEVRKLP